MTSIETIADEEPPDERAPGFAPEIELLTYRMLEAHPGCSAAVVGAVIEEVYDTWSGARIQTFRSILAERTVGRRLAALGASGHEPAAQPPDDIERTGPTGREALESEIS